MRKTNFAILALCLALASPLFAQKKEDERLANSARVLQAITGEKGVPVPILQEAACVAVYPSVKKVAVGIGGSYGRGVLVCRKGAKMDGPWGAPAMYSLDTASLGVQLGSSATDYVLVVLSNDAAETVIKGKTKLGSNASVAAGPTGATAAGFSPQATILTYSRTKGVFAGVSLAGASVDDDKDANKNLYGKEMSAQEIVTGETAVPTSGEALVSFLQKTAPTRNTI
ncbi:MAG: lipid-binding SYLF domain-containing protein [Acidobacteriaceae bacterium]|nr:lipid-binding SYLF domain-containing protein [Acidobacteriaceae bacterium]